MVEYLSTKLQAELERPERRTATLSSDSVPTGRSSRCAERCGGRPQAPSGYTVSQEEARKWQRIIRESVREACQTWRIQAQAGPVTSQALEAIVYRAAVPILLLLEHQPPEAIAALAPSIVRIMLAAAVEVVSEEGKRQ